LLIWLIMIVSLLVACGPTPEVVEYLLARLGRWKAEFDIIGDVRR
jgi:hypothetical protein